MARVAALAEVMLGPYRQDNPALVARKRLKFIDALHVATAVHAGCPFLITNDAQIGASDGLEVISLAELLA